MSHPFLSALLPGMGVSVPGFPMITQGQAFFVNPYYGTGDGKKPTRALTSLAEAANKVTANHNDVVYMLGANNTAAYTTDYQSSKLTWSTDLTHIVGVGPGQLFSPRARIAFVSTYTTASPNPLMEISANGSMFANLGWFMGLAGNANPLGALLVSGSRNRFYNCHIAGIGATQNDIANAYSLKVTGAENYFENCVIGLDTIDRGGADSNWEIEIGALAARTVFRKCVILSRIKHATYHPQVHFDAPTASTDPSFVLFDDCTFVNTSTNYAFTQTYIMTVATNSLGVTALIPMIKNCAAFTGSNSSTWSATGVYTAIVNSAVNSAYTGGVGYRS